MALRVNDDASQLFALRQTKNTQSEIGKHLASIASGLRINRASDDVAGLAVAESLSSQSRGLNVASRNIQDFSSLAQTAESGLFGIQEMSQRIGELAVQASNGTLTDDDRALIQNEVTQITQEIDRQASSVKFNGVSLLNGGFSGSAKIGPGAGDTISLNLSASDSASLGFSGIDVTTQAGAQTAIGVAQGAVNSVATERAAVGATVNRLQAADTFAQIARENTIASESVIRDADMALELIGLTTSQIRENAGLASIAQGNINRDNAIRLLGT